jgi:hypothetical protein
MNYRRHSYIFLGLISLLSTLRAVAVRAYDLMAIPVMTFIRLAPVMAVVARLQPLKVIAFRAINLLKPVYRESHETHGLSLTSVRD